MARQRKSPPTLDDMGAPQNEDTARIAQLESDVRTLATYIVERDQLHKGNFAKRIVELSQERQD